MSTRAHDPSDLPEYAPVHGHAAALQAQLARTPWWMSSVAAHAVVLLLTYFVMYSAPAQSSIGEFVMEVPPPEVDDTSIEIPPEEIHEQLDKEIQSEDPAIDEPVIKDAEVADHNETDDNEEYEANKGDSEDAMSDKPFQGKYWNDAIGVGPGAGGAYGSRFGGKRNLVAKSGWSRATEVSVEAGLAWLRRHQAPDGSWSCDNFQACCQKNLCDGRGRSAEYTPGTTGLALLAFLGAGHSTRSGKYKEIVKRAVKYLKSIQTPDGCVGAKTGDGHYLYNHAICTMALAEAYGLAGKPPTLATPAQSAVDFLIACQNPYLGWRYGMKPGDNDTSVTGWAVLALKSAILSELTVPPSAFEGARNWLDKVTDESFCKTGYTQKGDNGAREAGAQSYRPTEAMTAAGLASRIFMGAAHDDPLVKGGAALLRAMPPKWEPETGNDFYYWYYGTLAMFQLGNENWKVWNAGLKDALVKSQARGGDEDGSWAPCDAWGAAGGRVYSTAINTLSLEIYYRYNKVLGGGKK